FTAEASDLGERFSGLLGPTRLLSGFELVSQRTDKVVEMRLARPHYDFEGELTHWEFNPIDCESFNNLIVFND
ncbi:hypothetical protein LCGC14_3091100, partial [marine sediment metagenome]